MNRMTWAGAGLLLMVACSGPVPVSYDVAQIGGGVGFDNDDNVQSETALAIGHAFLFTNVVAFYNDFSVNIANPLYERSHDVEARLVDSRLVNEQ